MVVDTSAVVAFLRDEPEADRIQMRFEQAGTCCMSAVTAFECRTVLLLRFGASMLQEFEDLIGTAGIAVVPFDEARAEAAFDAYRRFGKGTGHPARLNLADCAAYALAKTLGMPLLFKGDDFSRTDILSALA